MSYFNVTANLTSIYSDHLFSNPLCKEQSFLKRIANVVFHILTLGIPLAIYHVVSCCYSRTAFRQKNENLQTIGINSIQQNKSIKPYSTLGQEALEFARKKLEENPNIATLRFSDDWYVNLFRQIIPEQTKHLVNPDIARLITLYWIVFKNFKDLIKQNYESSENNQEVINAADACMKIEYAISNLFLDNLMPLTETLSSKDKNRIYAEAFPYRSSFYHWLHGPNKLFCDKDKEELFFSKTTISATLKAIIQNSWNILHNDYWDRARLSQHSEIST